MRYSDLETSEALLSGGDEALVELEEVGEQLPELLLLHGLEEAGGDEPLQAALLLHSLDRHLGEERRGVRGLMAPWEERSGEEETRRRRGEEERRRRGVVAPCWRS